MVKGHVTKGSLWRPTETVSVDVSPMLRFLWPEILQIKVTRNSNISVHAGLHVNWVAMCTNVPVHHFI